MPGTTDTPPATPERREHFDEKMDKKSKAQLIAQRIKELTEFADLQEAKER